MKLRKLSSHERINYLGKLFVVGLFIGLLFLAGCLSSLYVKEYKTPKLSLNNFTCSEIYNLTIQDKLFGDHNNNTRFSEAQITLYYIENCKED